MKYSNKDFLMSPIASLVQMQKITNMSTSFQNEPNLRICYFVVFFLIFVCHLISCWKLSSSSYIFPILALKVQKNNYFKFLGELYVCACVVWTIKIKGVTGHRRVKMNDIWWDHINNVIRLELSLPSWPSNNMVTWYIY